MKVLQSPLLGSLGRFGNQIIEYMCCLTYASRHNAILENPPWIGERLFWLNRRRITEPGKMIIPGDPEGEKLDVVAVPMFWDWPNEFMSGLRPFDRIRESLRWRRMFSMDLIPILDTVVHVRGTDWKLNANLPQFTCEQMLDAVSITGIEPKRCVIISDEKPSANNIYEHELDHIYDFQLMVAAKRLFVYPSSTYSFCASLLSSNEVYDPTIKDGALSFSLRESRVNSITTYS